MRYAPGMEIEGLLELHDAVVRPEWIDYNGHMNVAYYLLAFDHATDAFTAFLGLGPAYLEATRCSTFSLDANLTFDREVKEGDPLRFTTQLLDHDRKRIHYIHCMYHATEGYLAATNEGLSAHVDLGVRRTSALPDAVHERLSRILAVHRTLPVPRQAGRRIGIRRR